jgi:hypothetical protein
LKDAVSKQVEPLRDAPPILHIAITSKSSRISKINLVNALFSFPLRLDVPVAGRDSSRYVLFAVVSASEYDGTELFLAPNLSDQWIKFQGGRVSLVGTHRAVDEQFWLHGEQKLLVYLRDSQRQKLFFPRISKSKRRFEASQPTCFSLGIFGPDSLYAAAYAPITTNILYESSPAELLDAVSRALPSHRQNLRLWLFRSDGSSTMRLDVPINLNGPDQSVGGIFQGRLPIIWAESVSSDEAKKGVAFQADDVLVSIKLFDPESCSCAFQFNLFAQSSSALSKLAPLFAERISSGNSAKQQNKKKIAKKVEYLYFKEVSATRALPLDPSLSIERNGIHSGDIVIVQYPLKKKQMGLFEFSDPVQLYARQELEMVSQKPNRAHSRVVELPLSVKGKEKEKDMDSRISEDAFLLPVEAVVPQPQASSSSASLADVAQVPMAHREPQGSSSSSIVSRVESDARKRDPIAECVGSRLSSPTSVNGHFFLLGIERYWRN